MSVDIGDLDPYKRTGFPDAGIFLDAPNTHGDYTYRHGFIGADPVRIFATNNRARKLALKY